MAITQEQWGALIAKPNSTPFAKLFGLPILAPHTRENAPRSGGVPAEDMGVTLVVYEDLTWLGVQCGRLIRHRCSQSDGSMGLQEATAHMVRGA